MEGFQNAEKFDEEQKEIVNALFIEIETIHKAMPKCHQNMVNKRLDTRCCLCRTLPANKTRSHMVPNFLAHPTFSWDGKGKRFREAFGPFYLVAFVLLFVNIKWHPWFLAGCRFLGKYSTSVWLIHTWFCYYLFHDFIYGFHYPLLILAVELAMSIMVGYIIQKVAKGVYH